MNILEEYPLELKMCITDKLLEEHNFIMDNDTYLEFPSDEEESSKSDSSDSEKKDAEYDIVTETYKTE